jgi:hypothetical protein
MDSILKPWHPPINSWQNIAMIGGKAVASAAAGQPNKMETLAYSSTPEGKKHHCGVLPKLAGDEKRRLTKKCKIMDTVRSQQNTFSIVAPSSTNTKKRLQSIGLLEDKRHNVHD